MPLSRFRFARNGAVSDVTPRRLLWTTSESADRSRGHACFALAEQASEETGPAHLVLVRSGHFLRAAADARISRKAGIAPATAIPARSPRRQDGHVVSRLSTV
jgi:hypothetical protein